ncbi:myc box-dependent-interacting protein 1 [Anopheles nili]|uniref:myc box-dependent-interacting protein 1 n=1 Tax=Anopheles nili TaxID=185578 RepID=UPI00237BF698|nr:myc box-dependent-interacting protein 1 [Anopheles nili]
MAENKGILLAKSVQKHAGRAKEKLLQNLGKVDRTADEIFDEHLTNFNRQHTCATRLQKEFSNYIRCVRAAQNASKSLMDAITEVYESQWTGSEVLYGQTKAIDTQYQQFSYKLADQVLKQLDTYALQFPEMKKKIDKRGRKLVDYDSQRHSFQSLQANAAKRKDDYKVTKGREMLEEAKSTYEVLNSELHDELPALFDSRILFLVTNLQTLFACEQQFHGETSKVYADLEAIVDKLATESQRGSYTLKKMNANSNPSSPQQSPVKANLSIVNNVTNGSANANGHTSAQSASPTPRTPTPQQQQRLDQPVDSEPSYQNTEMVKAAAAATIASLPTTNGTVPPANGKHEPPKGEDAKDTTPKENGQPASVAENSASSPDHPVTTNGTLHPHPQSPTNQLHQPEQTSLPVDGVTTSSSGSRGPQENGTSEQPSSAPTSNVTAAADDAASANTDAAVATPATTGAAVSQTSATTTDLPAGVLYRVKATYKYVREDVDELSFEVGDVINVVEYEDPEDQEEGWLMGLKEGSTEKGMFPANFTRPL